MTDNDSSSPPEEAEIVIIDWQELIKGSPSVALEQAFGPTGTGIVALRNVPGFVQAKEAFLPLAHTLATLPADYLEANMTDPESLYNAGWSHGKEKLGDKADLAKGSFYYNPVTDVPGTPEDRANYPFSYPKNVWPEEKIPSFKEKACCIGVILKDAVVELTRHLDALAHARQKSYPPTFLHDTLKDTEKVKARLLYYFPTTNTKQQDSWIGWHNDSGFLTALAGDLYVNHETGQVLEDCPDPKAGLYVATQDERVLHVTIPKDCMAVQMGECTQIVTGGTVCATPHCVRGTSGVARISLPCFVDTPPTAPLLMPEGSTREAILAGSAAASRRVPPLEKRWTRNGMPFGDFLKQTFELYYDFKA
jgi:isopenicillin N synthase-like dioxygenase